MFSAQLSSKFSSLLFRAARLREMMEREKRRAKVDGLRLMRLNRLRLKVMENLHALLSPALQPVPVRLSRRACPPCRS